MSTQKSEISVSLKTSPPEDSWFHALAEGISPIHPARFPVWGKILESAFQQKSYTVTAEIDGRPVGVLPLVFMKSLLFGKFLISQPYLNVGGILTPDSENVSFTEDFGTAAGNGAQRSDRIEVGNDSPLLSGHCANATFPAAVSQAEIDRRLVDEAVKLADQLDVRYLELRNEREIPHPALSFKRTSKVLMRLNLPETPEELWNRLSAKVRNQVRKGEKAEHKIRWGGRELVPAFYRLFAHTMRDVGTPVYPRRLFEMILDEMPETAEICVISDAAGRDVAAGLLLHGREMTEVPSAAALRSSHANCANMFMYWHLLKRSVERGQTIFDFGRSSVDSNTWRFKKQWGALPSPSVWQYYVRRGSMDDMRPEGFSLAIRVWKKLPVWVTRILGPWIVRGIP